jgi:hypothetical protein
MVNSKDYESKGKERKDLIIKQTTTTTVLRKPVILVVISFFALAVFFGLYANSASVVFAAFQPHYICIPSGGPLIECCDEIHGTVWCTTCDNTSPPTNCGPRYPGSIAPPPSTKTCPENTAVDANGNCAPVTQGPKGSPPSTGVDCTKNPDDPSCKPTRLKPTVDCTKNPDDPLCKPVGINPPPSDSANLAPDNNKNNNPPSTEDNKPKGSELGQSIGGGLSATKKGNKDNSPTPPPCPTDNSPIPPNCTLKPKF